MELNLSTYKNKKILITGVTGFKGSWLYLILKKAGARICGLGLEPDEISLFKELKLHKVKNIEYIDIRNKKKFGDFIYRQKPELIFHLAAQAIVINSYKNAEDTFDTNIKGLINLFEISKEADYLKGLLIITSDKCYRNAHRKTSFTERDALGGFDPYSASKACAEIISEAYYNSFFKSSKYISTLRAGNIIGGGDFSEHRILPDAYRAILTAEELEIRNPDSVRPWQYILDALTGYLIVGEKIIRGDMEFFSNWNFAPSEKRVYTVKDILNIFYKEFHLKSDNAIKLAKAKYSEEKYLQLNSAKARKNLKWKNHYDTKQSVSRTAKWYYNYLYGNKAKELCNKEIEEYYKI